jgi:hypothetical protein
MIQQDDSMIEIALPLYACGGDAKNQFSTWKSAV